MDELSNDFDLEIMQNASWNLEYEDDFNETADNFGNGTNSNATIDCGVLDEDYIRVWSSFQWWLEGVGFTGLGIAGTSYNVSQGKYLCFSFSIKMLNKVETSIHQFQ